MRSTIRYLWITIVLLSQTPFPGTSIVQAEAPTQLQSYLVALAATDADEMVRVIVQKKNHSDAAEQFVREAGGEIVTEMPFIQAFTAKLTAGMAKQLSAHSAVRWVSLDAPMISTNATDGSQANLRDDFSLPILDGSDGSRAWESEWQEIGEADGAAQGDVAVTDFWGGALQGLRIKGSGKGIMRAVDFTNTTHARLSIAYRRKNFVEGDSLTLQLSNDAGATWTDLVHLTTPGTDSEIQFAAYEINQLGNTQALVRLLNSATQSGSALFYLDFIDIQTNETSVVDESQLTNKLYLPLISGDSLEKTEIQNVTIRDARVRMKMESPLHSSAVNTLQNSFISSIRADTVWSTFPNLRGTGIGVAVVDSGITDHPDLWDDYGNYRLVQKVQFGVDNAVPDDYYGHGTHIAGTIIGDGWGSDYAYPGVATLGNIIDVKVTNDYGFGTMSDAITGLQWIYDNRNTYNIKVVNLSLNSSVPEPYHTSPLNAALEILWFNKIVVVVSAGNKGSQQLYPPANDPFVITVGAVDNRGTASFTDDVIAPYSAFGVTEHGYAKPDIVAPGSNIISVLASDDSNLAVDYPANRIVSPMGFSYFKISGTSMAAAVVSGAVALLVQDEPNLTPDQIKYRLRATARPLPNQAGCAAGAGMLDIYAAVTGTTSQSANTNLQASQLLWSGSTPVTWSNVNWNSVNWNSVNWNSVNWNSVNWNSFNRNSVNWNSSDTGNSTTASNCAAAITKLTLINAGTDQDMQRIYDNAMLYTNRLGSNSLSVRADTFGTVESVKFEMNGMATRIENAPPYSLQGNINSNYNGFSFAPGLYTLKVTAYSQDNGLGTALVTQQINFSVVGSSSCELEGKVVSGNLGVRVPMKIVNNFGTQVNVYWLNYSGAREFYTTLDPGQSWIQNSYAQHSWLIARSTDNGCVYVSPTVANDPIVTKRQHVELLAAHSNKCVDIAINTGTGNSVAVQQTSCSNAAWQDWEQIPATGGFTLRNLHTGRCMDLKSASTTAGATVQQYDCHGGNNQILYWSGSTLRFKHSNLCLDVSGASTADGATLKQWNCTTGATNQSFRMR